MPPKKDALGIFAPSLGYLIVALPIAMAITLQMIITRATLGVQDTDAGVMARRDRNMLVGGDALSSAFKVTSLVSRKRYSSPWFVDAEETSNDQRVAECEESFSSAMQWVDGNKFGIETYLSHYCSNDGDANEQECELKAQSRESVEPTVGAELEQEEEIGEQRKRKKGGRVNAAHQCSFIEDSVETDGVPRQLAATKARQPFPIKVVKA